MGHKELLYHDDPHLPFWCELALLLLLLAFTWPVLLVRLVKGTLNRGDETKEPQK